MVTAFTLRPNDCAANGEDAFDSAMKDLASKRKELHDMPVSEWLQILQELDDTLRQREKEWSSVNHWLMEDACIHKLCSQKMKDDIIISGGVDVPERLHDHASLARVFVSGSLKPLYVGLKDALKYRHGESDIPNFIQSKKEMMTTQGRKYAVYGPCAIPTIPNHDYEAWCHDNDSNNDDKIPEDVMKPEQQHGDKETGGFTLVLGAGNQVFLTLVDTIQMIFHRKDPVLIKHHPLRPHLIAPYQILFEPLIKRGYVQQMLDRGNEYSSKHILANPLMSHIHITGALATVQKLEETLVKVRGLSKADAHTMVSSELGCASPFIITPGVYTTAEMKNAITIFLTSRKTNGGSNCLSSQILVLPKEWKQKDEFRKLFDEMATAMPQDLTYYPGSLEKRKRLSSSYDKAGRSSIVKSKLVFDVGDEDPDLQEELSEVKDECNGLVVVECGTPGEASFNEAATANESFSAMVAVVELPGGGGGDDEDHDAISKYMMDSVVKHVNDKSLFFGSLVCSVVHPKTTPFPKDAVAALQYGTVAVNCDTAFGYGACYEGGRWGGHAMESLHQSGREYVGNIYSLPKMDKCVVYNRAGLASSPPLNKNSKTPALIFDVLHSASMCKTTSAGIQVIITTLIARLLQMIIPKSILVGILGKNAGVPYNSPLFAS